jgi:hypothetical protein
MEIQNIFTFWSSVESRLDVCVDALVLVARRSKVNHLKGKPTIMYWAQTISEKKLKLLGKVGAVCMTLRCFSVDGN